MGWIRLTRRPDGRLDAEGDLHWFAGYQCDAGGIFAGWDFTPPDLTRSGPQFGDFSLFNDRYGLYPLFAWCADDRCVVASSIHEVLDAGAPPDLDDDAMAVFTRIGFHLGDDTPFLAIRTVPPNATLRWDEAGPRIVGHVPHADRLELARDDAIDAFLAAFRRAITRRPPPPQFVLPLSGGRDSRHILLALCAAGAWPDACVTVDHFPPRQQGDREVAAALCSRLGIRHVALPQDMTRLDAEHEKNRRTSLCSDEHAQFVTLANYLRQVTAESYDGIAGDVLTQSSYLTPSLNALFEAEDWSGAAEDVLDAQGRTVTEAALASLLHPRLLHRFSRERARARIERELRCHARTANPIGSFYFWNRTRREIALAPYGVMPPVTMIAPFLDREVYDLVTALPAALLMDRRFHTDAIARAFPNVSDIPYEGDAGVCIRESSHPDRALPVKLLKLAWRHRDFLSFHGLAPGLIRALSRGHADDLWHLSVTVVISAIADTSNCRERVTQFAPA